MNIREKQADKMAQSKQAGRRFSYLYLHEGERNRQQKTRVGPMRGEKRKTNKDFLSIFYI